MTTKNKKLLLLFIIVLLIANSIFTAVLWFRQNCHHNKVEERNTPLQRNTIFSDFVGFDSTQQIVFDTLFDQHHRSMRALKVKEKAAKLAFFNLLKSDTASDATVQFYANKAALISMQIDTLTYYHFKKIKSICKPEQMSKLEDFFDNHFLHQHENNPDKSDSNSTNKDSRKDFRRLSPPNGGPDGFRPEGTPPPPPGEEMNGDAPPPPPPGRRMGPPGEHRPPHDGPPPPDRRPPGPPETN